MGFFSSFSPSKFLVWSSQHGSWLLICLVKVSRTNRLVLYSSPQKETTLTWDAWTMMGTPKSLWPVNPIARGTEEDSTNSMYAIPFDLLEFLSEIILTSLTYSERTVTFSEPNSWMAFIWNLHKLKVNWLFQRLRRNPPGPELWFLQQAAYRKQCGHLSPLVLDCQLVPLGGKGQKPNVHVNHKPITNA